jgi:membrane protease YdiL (CAAX protease family)
VDTQVRCGFCGHTNLSSAFSCASCFMPIVDALDFGGVGAPATPDAPAPAASASAAPAAAIEYGPYTGPPKGQASEVMASIVTELEAPPRRAASPEATATAETPPPGFRISPTVLPGVKPGTASVARPSLNPDRVAWHWYDLIAIACLVWGMPYLVSRYMGIDRSLSALINRELAVQIVGYLIGILAVTFIIWTRQKGDWATLGLGDDARKGRRDFLRGALLGAAIFAAYIPLGYFAPGGLSVQGLVALLLGNASGWGLVLTCVVVIVGAPFIEEIFFRGILYEKIARRNELLAVAVTSVLFMLVHGGIILQILALGVLFARKRAKETVWYTMGAHSAWNASVVLLGVVLLAGGTVHFTATSGAFDLHYPRGWERHADQEQAAGPMRVDLAVRATDGSRITIVELKGATGGTTSGRDVLKLVQAQHELPEMGEVHRSAIPFDGAATAYEMEAGIVSDTGLSMHDRMVAAILPESDTVFFFELACMSTSCDTATEQFDQLLYSVHFNRAAL